MRYKQNKDLLIKTLLKNSTGYLKRKTMVYFRFIFVVFHSSIIADSCKHGDIANKKVLQGTKHEQSNRL